MTNFIKKMLILFIFSIFICMPFNLAALNPNSNSDLSSKYANWIEVDKQESPLLLPDSIGVDSTGKLYICNDNFHKIQVYQNGKFVYSYDVNTTGALIIRVDNQDNLYISVFRTDYGFKYKGEKLIEVVNNINNNKYYPQDNNSMCNDKYGSKYSLHNILGYIYVSKTTKNNSTTTIFSMPIKDFVLIFLITLIIITAFCLLLIFVIKTSIKFMNIK